MKASNVIAFAIGAGLCVTLYACGGDGRSSSAAAAPVTMQPSPPPAGTFTVNDVLLQARAQSETADPMGVNGGSVNPVLDESSDPATVD